MDHHQKQQAFPEDWFRNSFSSLWEEAVLFSSGSLSEKSNIP